MAVQEKLYTADDLWVMSGQVGDRKRLELVKGVIVEMSPTGDAHGILAMEIGRLIANYVVEHDLGDTTAAETGFVLFTNPDTVRAPDVAFISKARRTPLTGKYYRIAPDLVVEVVSPGDTAREIREKVADYLNAGTQLVWVVYPEVRLIDVYQPDHTIRTLNNDDVLDGGGVLPGFSVAVKSVFGRLERD